VRRGFITQLELKMTRKVVTGSPHREVGLVNPRWLINHPIHHESHLERRFVMAALACPVVTDIIHQPIEVKPTKFLPKHQETLEAAGEVLARQGKKYLVITDSEIDRDGLGKRAILLMRYARMQLDPETVHHCIRLVETMATQDPTLRELLAEGLSEAEIWNLVARHELRIPPGILLEANTPVSINNQKENCHDQLCAWFGVEAR
jgi:hypothetical protein